MKINLDDTRLSINNSDVLNPSTGEMVTTASFSDVAIKLRNLDTATLYSYTAKTMTRDTDTSSYYLALSDLTDLAKGGNYSIAITNTAVSFSPIAGTLEVATDMADDVELLRKIETNRKKFELVGSVYSLVIYDDDDTTQLLNMVVKNYAGGDIGTLIGSTTPSTRNQNTI